MQFMPGPRMAGFTVRPITLDDAAAWARYACRPEVKQHTSSTAASVDDVRAVIQRVLADNWLCAVIPGELQETSARA
jgi:hypothetical protein